jgi:hypothetical protein
MRKRVVIAAAGAGAALAVTTVDVRLDDKYEVVVIEGDGQPPGS